MRKNRRRQCVRVSRSKTVARGSKCFKNKGECVRHSGDHLRFDSGFPSLYSPPVVDAKDSLMTQTVTRSSAGHQVVKAAIVHMQVKGLS